MNEDHKFEALDWNYASVQDIAGHRQLKSIDGDFSTFEINQRARQCTATAEHTSCNK